MLFGKPQANANGEWELQLVNDLSSPQTNLSIAEYSAAGALVSGWTNVTINITGNGLPPGSAPTLTSPTTVNSQRPLLKGKAAANAIVYVYLAGGSVLFGMPKANANGEWELQLVNDLSPPQTNLSIAECSAAGALVSGWTNVTINITGNGLPPGSAPTLTSPTTVNSQRPLLKGKAAANAIVYVYLAGGSVLFGMPKANANGEWELQLVNDLSPPQTNLSIAECSAAGALVSGWTNVTINITGNGLPPGSAPTLTSPTTVNSQRPLLKGKAAANAIVYVYLAGGSVLFGMPKANANGEWELQLVNDLSPPQTNLSIAECSAAGALVSGWTNVTINITGNGLPPGSAPTLTSPTTVNSQRPLLKGNAAANAIVYVYLAGGSVLFGKPQANANGEWELQLVNDLSPPQTNLSIAECSAAGALVSGWTNVTINITGNGLPPGSAPTLTSPTTVNSQRPLLKGKAAANAIVYVYLAGGSVLFGKPQANANGEWELQLANDLSSPQTNLSIAECSAAGALVSGWTNVTINITGNGLPPGSAPTLTSPTTVNSQRPLLKGNAAANAIVYVYLAGGSVLFGKPQANANGEWELQLVNDLSPPQTNLSIAEYSAAGALVSGWTNVTINITGNGLPPGSAPTLTSPTTVNSQRPLLKGNAAANAIVYVYLAGGSVLFGKPQANANGEWELQLANDLSSPQTNLSIAEYSAAGALVSGWTNVTINITGNGLPPGSAPTLTSPTTVNSQRPLLKGNAAANAIVYVYLAGGSVLFGKPQANANGEWELQLVNDLSSPQTNLSIAEYSAAGALVSGWTNVTMTVSA
ncbi:hypothetical protein ABVN22_09775 [Pseudomonas poae]|uniref:hypothetical protein n=2 Tax=Pseudomonas poae TaxID=200451 RepID=UPI00336A4BD4